MRRSMIVVMATLFVMWGTRIAFSATAISSPWMAADTWQAGDGCNGSYYDQNLHTNLASRAIDFNRYPICNSDEHYPILAVADGIVKNIGWSGGLGYRVELDHGTMHGVTTTTLYGHFYEWQPYAVVTSEAVKQGQVLGYCGTSGKSTGNHLHFEQRESGRSVLVASMDGHLFCEDVCNGDVLTSHNTGVFDREYAANGGAGTFGSLANPGNTYAGVHWYNDYNAANLYRVQGVPNNCCAQDYQGGIFGRSIIVYDALGGARKAYTVRTGFFQNNQHNGWAELGGPISSLGMPVTNEYETSPGYAARQDFQLGWLNWINGTCGVHTWYRCAPGWTSTGWNTTVSYRLAQEYEERGSSVYFGDPLETAHLDDDGIWRQQCANATIEVPDTYDADGQGGPPLPAVALLLHNIETGDWWACVSNGTAFVNPGGVNVPTDLWLTGWARSGDQGYTFTEYTGDPNGDGFSDLLVQRSDANWYVAWNNGNGSFTQQSEPIKAQWGTDAAPGKYSFWSADVNGDSQDELLTYDASNGNWYVCAFDPVTSTYVNCSPWLTWGGGIGVFQPLVGDWNGDGLDDLCLRHWATGCHYVRLSTGSGFIQGTNDNWATWGASASSATFTPLVGDWNGDGLDDLLLHDPTLGNWWVRTSSGTQFVFPNGASTPADLFLAGWAAGSFTPFAADVDEDGDTDIGVRSAATGDHFVRLSTGTAFTLGVQDNWCPAWGASSAFQLLVGRFGDGAGRNALQAPMLGLQDAASVSTATQDVIRPALSTAGLVCTRTGAGLRFSLPGFTPRLTITTITGRTLRTLTSRNSPYVLWDGCDEQGRKVPSGIYLATAASSPAVSAKIVLFR